MFHVEKGKYTKIILERVGIGRKVHVKIRISVLSLFWYSLPSFSEFYLTSSPVIFLSWINHDSNFISLVTWILPISFYWSTLCTSPLSTLPWYHYFTFQSGKDLKVWQHTLSVWLCGNFSSHYHIDNGNANCCNFFWRGYWHYLEIHIHFHPIVPL